MKPNAAGLLLAVTIPIYAQTPCDRAIGDGYVSVFEISNCLAEFKATPPIYPIFDVGYTRHTGRHGSYASVEYYGLGFGGYFNDDDYADILQKRMGLEPTRLEEVVKDIRRALLDSPVHRMLLLTKPGGGTYSNTLKQLREHYGIFYERLVPKLVHKQTIPEFRAMLYESFAEIMVCKDCSPCQKPFEMQPERVSGSLPESGMAAWQTWRRLVDYRPCLTYLRRRKPAQRDGFESALVRMLTDGDAAVFRSKLYESVAESQKCGAGCQSFCKRFLLLENLSEDPPRIPKTETEPWKIWRATKVEQDRRGCVVDIKSKYPEVWRQLNLIEQRDGDPASMRIRSLVKSVDPYQDEVSWVEAQPWLESDHAAAIMGAGVLGSALLFLLTYRLTGRGTKWAYLPQDAPSLYDGKSPEVDVTIKLSHAGQDLFKALGYQNQKWCGAATGDTVPAEKEVLISMHGDGWVTVTSPVSGKIKSVKTVLDEEKDPSYTVTVRADSKALQGQSAVALAQKAFKGLLDACWTERTKRLKITRAFGAFSIVPLLCAVAVAFDFLIVQRIGVLFDQDQLVYLLVVLFAASAALFVITGRLSMRVQPFADGRLQTLVTSTITAKAVDHRAEFEEDIKADRAVQESLSTLGFPLLDWTFERVELRKRHWDSLARVGTLNVASATVPGIREPLEALAKRHPYVFPKGPQGGPVL